MLGVEINTLTFIIGMSLGIAFLGLLAALSLRERKL